MIVGLQRAAEYMTSKGRPTTDQGLWTLLVRGRHQDIGLRPRRGQRRCWEFTEAELDRLIARVPVLPSRREAS